MAEALSISSSEEKRVPYQLTELAYTIDRQKENKYILSFPFLDGSNLTSVDRCEVIDWIAFFCVISGHHEEVLHLTVAIFDRYVCAKRNIEDKWLVVVGSLLIAFKLEGDETRRFQIEELPDLLLQKFSVPSIKEMEIKILKELNFNVMFPTSFHFLSRCIRICGNNEIRNHLGMFLIELGCLHYSFTRHLPSKLAAAAFCFSLAFVKNEADLKKIWSPELRAYTLYSLDELIPIIGELSHLLVSLQGCFKLSSYIFKKYASPKYYEVARLSAVYSFCKKML